MDSMTMGNAIGVEGIGIVQSCGTCEAFSRALGNYGTCIPSLGAQTRTPHEDDICQLWRPRPDLVGQRDDRKCHEPSGYMPMRGDRKREQIDAILSRLESAEARIAQLERGHAVMGEAIEDLEDDVLNLYGD